MTLNAEQRKVIVKIRLDNAQKTLDDATLLFDNNSLRSATNRTYYSMFYAVSALAIADGKTFRKHGHLIAYFQKEYIKSGLFDRKHGRALQKSFEDRSEADYQDYLRLTAEQVHSIIEEAQDFLLSIKAYIEKKEKQE